MTRQELMELVKPLRWQRNFMGRLRCKNGHCPIIAAAQMKGFHFNLNWQYKLAGQALNLSVDDVASIASDADSGFVPELEKLID